MVFAAISQNYQIVEWKDAVLVFYSHLLGFPNKELFLLFTVDIWALGLKLWNLK